MYLGNVLSESWLISFAPIDNVHRGLVRVDVWGVGVKEGWNERDKKGCDVSRSAYSKKGEYGTGLLHEEVAKSLGAEFVDVDQSLLKN